MAIKTILTHKPNYINKNKLPLIVLYNNEEGIVVGIATSKYTGSSGEVLVIAVLHSDCEDFRPGDRLELSPSLYDIKVYDGIVELSNS